MERKTGDQVTKWLKKLERESWQLELLVSAFTIFLLIGAGETFGNYLTELQYEYSFESFQVFFSTFDDWFRHF